MSEVAVCRCLKWGGSEWPSCWKMAAGKLQKIGCFVNISSEDLQKADPNPFAPPFPFTRLRRLSGSGLTDKQISSFISFSLSLSLSRRWYLIWSLFNDPKWLKLHILSAYCWAGLVWYRGTPRARTAIFKMLWICQQKEQQNNFKVSYSSV